METENQDVIIVAPQIPPGSRHSIIFQSFDDLKPEMSIVVVNDHDPAPLLRQFEKQRQGEFVYNYLENGPITWKVKVTKIKKEGCCGFCGG
jgi:uncharacterized protein (DUF2249 family)